MGIQDAVVAGGRRFTLTRLRSRLKDAVDPLDFAALALLVAIACVAAAWACMSKHVPDEQGYFAEIASIATTGSSKTFTGHVVGVWAHIGAVAYRLGQALGIDPLVAVRLLGATLVTIVSWLAYRTVRLIDDRPVITLGTMALVGFNPMYTFMGASANSDTMVVLWVSVVVWLAIGMLRLGFSFPRATAMLLVIVLGFYTKDRSLMAVPIGALGLTVALVSHNPNVLRIAARLKRHIRPERVYDAVIAVSVLFLLSRSQWVSSKVGSALSWETYRSPIGPLPSPGTAFEIWMSPGFADRLARQFYAYFGYLHVPAPAWVYTVQNALLVLAFAGLCVGIGRIVLRTLRLRNPDPEALAESPETHPGSLSAEAARTLGILLFAAAVLAAMYAVAMYQIRLPGGTQGRYLFPVIIPVYALVASGIQQLVPRMIELPAAAALAIMAAAINVYCLLYVLLPYFY